MSAIEMGMHFQRRPSARPCPIRRTSAYWCVLGREFSGMIPLNHYFVTSHHPSNPQQPPASHPATLRKTHRTTVSLEISRTVMISRWCSSSCDFWMVGWWKSMEILSFKNWTLRFHNKNHWSRMLWGAPVMEFLRACPKRDKFGSKCLVWWGFYGVF